MNYLDVDTIDWQAVKYIDEWLDESVGLQYEGHSLAQDWARISKVSEELGEAIQAFIGVTGQNPRKGVQGSMADVLEELADTMLTALFAMEHFTKDPDMTRRIIRRKLSYIEGRARNAQG